MKTIHISKTKLLERLKTNRKAHVKQFNEALEGYRDLVIEELNQSLRDAKLGKHFRTFIQLVEPQNHTPDYDAIIDQVEWHEAEIIELDRSEFNHYVRDDWGWKEDFIQTMSFYSKEK